ncbi:MAG: hypothetical protein WC620_11420 [Methanoregula sp.]
MKINGYLGLFAVLVIVLVCAAGCTTPQTPGAPRHPLLRPLLRVHYRTQ